MAQSLDEVRTLWEVTTRAPLSAGHHDLFAQRGEAAALAALPRRVVEEAAASTYAATGQLKLASWLEASVLQRVANPPLRIELVPSTCWWSNLRTELTPDQWKACKTWAAKRAGWRCHICGDRGPKWPVEYHEQWAYLNDDRPRVQRLDGVVALCPACKESTHMGYANVRGRHDEAMQHLVDINGWSLGRGEAYLEACGRIWMARSRHEWKLDVSWLALELGIAVHPKRPPPAD